MSLRVSNIGKLNHKLVKPSESESTMASVIIAKPEAVVIYPEGGRSDDGKLQPGKPGIGIIVEATGCPVIPTLLEGTYDALPPDAKWIRLRPIRVVYGPPMDFSSLLGRENGEEKKAVYQQISQEIMDRISALGGGMPSSAGCRSASI